MKRAIIIIYIYAFRGAFIYAQTGISLPQAIEKALASNQTIKSAQLQEQFGKLLSERTSDVAPAVISLSGGQVNSWYPDNVVSVQQNFNSLSWYRSQRELLLADLRRYQSRKIVVEVDLIKEVRFCFSEYVFLRQRLRMLHLADSLFSVFLKATAAQFKLGEINKVQLLTMQSRYGVLMRQLNQLESDLGMSHFKLQWLLNTTDSLIPQNDLFASNYPYQFDTSVVMSHPIIKAAGQEIKYAARLTGVEKSMLRPGWAFQYSNMTMKGSGADNKLYNYGTRFQNVTIGLYVPAFSAYRHQRIKAMKVNEVLMQNEQERLYVSLKSEYRQAFQAFTKAGAIHRFYRDSVQNSTDELQKLMSNQLKNGDISLPEWILTFNQLLDIKSQAIEAEWDVCKWYIQLLYLSNQ